MGAPIRRTTPRFLAAKLVTLIVGLSCTTAPLLNRAHGADLTPLLQHERSLWQMLQDIRSKVRQTQNALTASTRRSESLNYEQTHGETRSRALIEGLERRKKELQGRLLALYKLSRGRRAQLLLQTKSWRSAVERAGALRQVVRQSVYELRLFKKELAELQKRQKEIAKQLQQQQTARLRLAQMLTTLDASRRAKREDLAGVQAARRRSRRRKKHLSAKERRLFAQLRRLRRETGSQEGFANLKKRLIRPTACAMVRRGRSVRRAAAKNRRLGRVLIKNRQSGLLVARPGVSYRCHNTQSVFAVAPGVVRLSGPLPGYGKVVLLEHDSGYYSLYAYLARARPALGQRVSNRARIGRTGIDPLTGAQGLYFELRLRQHTLDPRQWLRP